MWASWNQFGSIPSYPVIWGRFCEELFPLFIFLFLKERTKKSLKSFKTFLFIFHLLYCWVPTTPWSMLSLIMPAFDVGFLPELLLLMLKVHQHTHDALGCCNLQHFTSTPFCLLHWLGISWGQWLAFQLHTLSRSS